MNGKFSLDTSFKKVFPTLLFAAGVAVAAALIGTRLNLVNLVALLYCCIMSAVITLSLIIKKRVYAPMIFGYAVGKAIESFYNTNIKAGSNVVVQAHEWQGIQILPFQT